MIRGGPAGPDGVGGSYANEVETDRAAWWHALGGAQGVIEGFVHAAVAGQMALDFTPGAALVGERAADGTASLDRGYLVWADSTTRVTFAPASAAARNDAVIACFADTEDGALGTGVTQVGPQIIAVTGVSGTTTPRTDAQINAALGRGGWVRLMDVPIASTDTQINVANIVKSTSFLREWHTVGATGEPAFQNSWTNESSANPHPSVGFKRDAAGNVWLRGAPAGGASGTTVFTLPVGYRPDALTIWSNSHGGSSPQVTEIQVGADGTVKVFRNSGGDPTTFGYFIYGCFPAAL